MTRACRTRFAALESFLSLSHSLSLSPSLFLSLSLSLSLSLALSIYLPTYLPTYLSNYLSIYLPIIHTHIHASVHACNTPEPKRPPSLGRSPTLLVQATRTPGPSQSPRNHLRRRRHRRYSTTAALQLYCRTMLRMYRC